MAQHSKEKINLLPHTLCSPLTPFARLTCCAIELPPYVSLSLLVVAILTLVDRLPACARLIILL